MQLLILYPTAASAEAYLNNQSLCLSLATTSDSEEGVTASVHGTLDRLLSKAASFKKKNLYYHCQLL